MIRPKVQITITQNNAVYADRTAVIIMDFVNELQINSSWKNLTDTASLKFPKNVTIKTKDGSTYDLYGAGRNVIAGDRAPFVMRGDKIKIEATYWYYDAQNVEQRPDLITLFEGYITQVKVKIPIEIECEDNMYILKQTTAPNKLFKGTVEDMVEELIKPLGFTLERKGVTTNVGLFRTQNETIAQVLERLRKDYRVEAWFRGTSLHCSPIVYFPSTRSATQSVFEFQNNIVSDSLNYCRLDDIVLGANAISVNKVELTGTTSKGKQKTTHKRLSVFVGKQGGEIRTLYFYDVTSESELKKMGEERLKRFYYEGYRGSFTTFGEPFVNHGDIIVIRDRVLPEREGHYFVKSVKRSMSVDNGYRQEIELDIKADIFTQSELNAGI